MRNYFEKQSNIRHQYFYGESNERYLFGDNIKHLRYTATGAASGAAGYATDMLKSQREAREKKTSQSGVDQQTTQIRSWEELNSLMKGGQSGRMIDIRTSKISPEVYAALSRGDAVEVQLQQMAPERVNLFTPLVASVMQLVGGLNGAGYNPEAWNGAIKPQLAKAADFVSRHGLSYSMGLGSGEHTDVIAEFKVLSQDNKPKKDPINITYKPINYDKGEKDDVSVDWKGIQDRFLRKDTVTGGFTPPDTKGDVPPEIGILEGTKPKDPPPFGDVLDRLTFKLLSEQGGYQTSLGTSTIKQEIESAGFKFSDVQGKVKDLLAGVNSQLTSSGIKSPVLNENSTMEDFAKAFLQLQQHGVVSNLYNHTSTGDHTLTSACVEGLDTAGKYTATSGAGDIAHNYIDTAIKCTGALDNFADPQKRFTPPLHPGITTDTVAAANKVFAEYPGMTPTQLLAKADELAKGGDWKKAGELYSSMFVLVENNTRVMNGNLGAGHISKIQAAISDRANMYVDGARAINVIASGKDLTSEETKGLNDLVSLYNKENTPQITVEQIKADPELAQKVLQFAKTNLESIKKTLSSPPDGAGYKDSNPALLFLHSKIDDITGDIDKTVSFMKEKTQGPTELDKASQLSGAAKGLGDVAKGKPLTQETKDLLTAFGADPSLITKAGDGDLSAVKDLMKFVNTKVQGLNIDDGIKQKFGSEINKFVADDGFIDKQQAQTSTQLDGISKGLDSFRKDPEMIITEAGKNTLKSELSKSETQVIAHLKTMNPPIDIDSMMVDGKLDINKLNEAIEAGKIPEGPLKTEAKKFVDVSNEANKIIQRGNTDDGLMKEYKTLIGGREYFVPFAEQMSKTLDISSLKTGTAIDDRKVAAFLEFQKTGGPLSEKYKDLKSLEGAFKTLAEGVDADTKPDGLKASAADLNDKITKFGLDRTKEEENREVLAKYNGGSDKSRGPFNFRSNSDPEKEGHVSSIIIQSPGALNDPQARLAVKDFLKLAARAGVISPSDLKDAGDNPAKLYDLFKTTEGVLEKKYGLKPDGLFGAEHINDIQEALYDRSGNLATGAQLIDKLYDGKEINPDEEALLTNLVKEYNSKNGTSINVSDLTTKDNAVGFLKFVQSELNGINSDIKATGYQEHGQLKELEENIDLTLTGKTGKTGDKSGIDDFISFIDTKGGYGGTSAAQNKQNALEFSNTIKNTAIGLTQRLQTGEITADDKINLNGKEMTVRDAVKQLAGDYKDFLLKGFEVNPGSVVEVTNELSALYKSAGVGFEDVSECVALILEGNSKGNAPTSFDEDALKVSKMGNPLSTFNLSDESSKAKLLEKRVGSLPDGNIKTKMTELAGQLSADPPKEIKKEDMKELFATMGKELAGQGQEVAKQFFALAEKLFAKTPPESKLDLSSIYQNYLNMGLDFEKAIESTLGKANQEIDAPVVPKLVQVPKSIQQPN